MASSKKILILFAHPVIHKSKVNAPLARSVRNTPGVTFHDLYYHYPDMLIDVRKEQELLLSHDVILFQHPFYWYSIPAIIKEWFDLVLEYGFAYGTGGTALKGKAWVHVLTAGGSEAAYRPDGDNKYTIDELMRPIEQTATLCGMHFLQPIAIHNALKLSENLEPVKEKYKKLLLALKDFDKPWSEFDTEVICARK